MIQDLDSTIQELLFQELQAHIPNRDAITFQAPFGDSWAPPNPGINCYLYDLRENKELKSNEQYLSRNFPVNGGATGTQTVAPIRMDISYLITVWAQEPEDEHRLLGTTLKALLRYPILPDAVLQGEMAHQPLPLRAWVSQPERTPNIWDFWGGIDGRMKVGISYVVTIAVEPFAPVEVGLVTEKILKIGQK